MLTKNMYDEACFVWCGRTDYMEIFRCVLLTLPMIALDIITSPFQIIAIIIGKIAEKTKVGGKQC